MSEGWLHNKFIVIVGGTTGIGKSAARAFIEHGAHVVVVGLDEASVESAHQDLGQNAIAVQGDACKEGVAASAIALCMKNYGAFNGLYHVAGGSGRKFGDGPLDALSLDGWNQTFTMNLTSLMLSNQAAVRAFIEAGHSGTILNMASVLAFSPSPKYFVTHAYAASKAAVIGFTKSIASYYASKSIRVNAIAPGLVDTPMAQRALHDDLIMNFIRTKQPLDQRIGVPQDLVGAAIYFMSDFSSFTTGQVLAVDGGWSVSEGQY
jgi:NAD(P)-dependent dehydrogenase (short-subunit alcohol dehydrogenase family)